MKEKPNRRQFLKLAGFGALGAGIDGAIGSASGALTGLATFGALRENRTKVNGITNKSQDKFEKAGLPSEIAIELAKYVSGLIMTESSFNPKSKSDKGAVGYVQFTKQGIKDLLKFKALDIEGRDLKDKVASVAKRLQKDFEFNLHCLAGAMTLLYKRLQRETLPALRAKLPYMSDREFSKLTVLIMLNAHNAGYGTMKGVLTSFITAIGDDSVFSAESATDAFNSIRNYGRNVYRGEQISFDKKTKNYGKDAFEYVAKIIYWANKMNDGTAPNIYFEQLNIDTESQLPVDVVLAGLAGAVACGAYKIPGAKPASWYLNRTIERRLFKYGLKATVVAGVLSLVYGIATDKINPAEHQPGWLANFTKITQYNIEKPLD